MEKRYTVRQAVTMTGVKSYVMRYWEEELDLHIGRNELGHRYYTPYDIQLFLKINELKSRGLQLKAIRTLIPRMERNTSGSVMPDAKILDGEAVEIEDIPLKETESRLQEEPQGFRKTENTHMSAEYEKRKKEGEQRSIETGKQSQKEEALRIGGKALRSVVMGLLASLIKDVIRKLIVWFRAGQRKLSTFIDSVKDAIKSFVSNIKEHLLNAGNTLVTTIATAIFGPVIGMIKKAWIFLKQGYKSVKQAIKFLKDPANKNMPFSIKMMEVGKIIIVGLTAGGAIVLSEVIEKGLMAIPGFAFEIPLLGSLASLIGMFLGALVSGLIGALALNVIDRMIANRLKIENDKQQLEKKNEVIKTQENLIFVTGVQVSEKKVQVMTNIARRHSEAGEHFNDIKNVISQNAGESDKLHDSTENTNNDISNLLDNL